MKRLLPLTLLLFAFAACEAPTSPTTIQSDDDPAITVGPIIISIGGDDNSTKDPSDPGPDPGVPGNGAPIVINPGPQTSRVGDSINLLITATDPDGDPIQTFSWVANTAPRNLTLQQISDDTALVSGVISESSAADSPFSTTVIANDGQASGSVTFTWTVLPALVS